MANTLRFKRGLVAGIPNGALGEPLFTTDTFDLYIGNGTGNTRFQKYIASGATTQILRGDGSLYTFPLNISSPSNGQVLKYDGTNWVNSADAGVTGSGTAGQVTYWGSSSTITGSGNLNWDNVNGRLGIMNTTPTFTVDVIGTMRVSQASTFSTSVTSPYFLATGTLPAHQTNAGVFQYFSNGVSIRAYGATSGTGFIRFLTGGGGGSADAEVMRLHATGNLSLNSTTDNGLRFQVTGDGFFSDRLGIGTTALTGMNFYILKNITGSTFSYGMVNQGAIQSGVTNTAMLFQTNVSTQNTNFSITNIRHYSTLADTTFSNVTAGGSVTNQYGFWADANLIGATNNFGFYGNIASGTGRWNLYLNGTANNYINGNTGFGTLPSAWGTTNSVRALQLASGSIWNFATTNFFIGQNYFYDGTNRVYVNTNAATEYAQITGRHIWYNAPSGTAGTTATLTERMRLDENGNLGLGVTPSSRLHVDAAAGSAHIRVSESGTTRGFVGGANGIATGLNGYFMVRGEAGLVLSGNGNSSDLVIRPTTANVLIGTTTDAGFRLDVNGTMRVSGASTITNGTLPSLKINHTAAGHASAWFDTNEFGLLISSASTSASHYLTNMTSGGTSRFRVNCDGSATFSSSVTAQTGLFGGNLGAANQRVANFRNSGGNGYIEIQGSGSVAGQIISDATGQLYFTTNATAGTAGTTRLFIDSDGDVAVNTLSPNASAILQADSTTKGFLPPRMTTTQRNAITTPAAGLIVYDTTDNKHYGYNGTTWNAFY